MSIPPAAQLSPSTNGYSRTIRSIAEQTLDGLGLNPVDGVATCPACDRPSLATSTLFCARGCRPKTVATALELVARLSRQEGQHLLGMALAEKVRATAHDVELLPFASEQPVTEWSKPQPAVISTGLLPLDELLGGGLESGSVYGLCAPTGMGKTGLAILIARTIAVDQTVVYFSTELPARQVIARVAAQVLRTPWRQLNRLTAESGLPLISQALEGLRLRVVELRRDTDIVEVLSRVADRDGQPPVLVLDYLQHAARRAPTEDRSIAVAGMSDTLTGWARDAKTTAVIVSSVARAKESGDVDFDCSAILFLDTIVDGVAPGGTTTARLHIAKSRFGTTGTVGLTFDGAIGLFTVDRAGTLTLSQQEIVDAVREGATTAADVAREVGRRRADVLATIAVLRTQGVLGIRPLRVVQRPSSESSRWVPTDGDDFAILGSAGTRNFAVPAGSQNGFFVGELGSGHGNAPQGGTLGSHPVGVEREPRPPEDAQNDLLDFEAGQ